MRVQGHRAGARGAPRPRAGARLSTSGLLQGAPLAYGLMMTHFRHSRVPGLPTEQQPPIPSVRIPTRAVLGIAVLYGSLGELFYREDAPSVDPNSTGRGLPDE